MRTESACIFHVDFFLCQEFAGIYRDAIIRYANKLLSGLKSHDDWEKSFTMEKALQSAFMQLDDDFKNEAFDTSSNVNLELLTIALSGDVSEVTFTHHLVSTVLV